jgi:hypothetical protein
MRRILAAVVLLGILVTAGVASAAGSLDISRSVVAGGGGKTSAGDYTLSATIGQPITGRAVVGSTDLCVGFWCGLARYDLFLPLVLRS